MSAPSVFWTLDIEALCAALDCGLSGLTTAEATTRLRLHGLNKDATPQRAGIAAAMLRRALEPLCLILLGAGALAAASGDGLGGAIVVAILVLSIGFDTLQEGRAMRAAEALRRSVAPRTEALRDGTFTTLDVEALLPGDIVRLKAGDVVPADALLVTSSNLAVGEAALTGEAYPVAKSPGRVTSREPAEATNAVFRGAVIHAGEALALVAATGPRTLFGEAASALTASQAPSPFQRDLHALGLWVARLTIALIAVVVVVHVLLGRPPVQSLMFAAALAVGLTPELLPMITTVTLTRGALRLAARRVIVKRLGAIHDLGAMTVLCTDKTGTLTSAEIALASSLDPLGNPHPRAALLGAVSARLGGDRGALDRALVASTPDAPGWSLLERRAFDFDRRQGSVLADGPDGRTLIVKGAPEAVLASCDRLRTANGDVALDRAARDRVLAVVRGLADAGLRAVVVASRPWLGPSHPLEVSDTGNLRCEGICTFTDPPKPSCPEALARLHRLGIRVKVLSGDDPVIVARLAAQVGLEAGPVLSGAEIAELGEEALAVRAQATHAYGRLTPDQKARLVKALSASGEVVGYLGDGINDGPALKAADIGFSVEGATGVAQAAADMILLAPDLAVLADGVEEGRRTFANILKYVRMGASSNFGNMLSMAAASLFLPFLPMLPVQILLNNLLYDMSEVGIPFDTVRPEAVAAPQVWNLRALTRFAAVMGTLSSAFDLLTFALMLALFHLSPEEFRTTWFLESMATQILVIFVLRTNGRPWHNRPHPALAASSLSALGFALAAPLLPLGSLFGFALPPGGALLTVAALVTAYLVSAEAIKSLATAASRRMATSGSSVDRHMEGRA